MNINLLSIDLAKNVFQLHGNDSAGKKVFTKRVSRAKLSETIATLPSTTIVMEACGGGVFSKRQRVKALVPGLQYGYCTREKPLVSCG